MRYTPIVPGLILLLLVGCGPESDDRIGSDRDPSDWVFAPDRVRDYHLTIDPDDLATLDNITYVHARFQCEDEVLLDVGVRFKGNSSYWAGGPKYSFKVDFNRYDPDLVFHDLRKLNFNSNFADPSMMRERLAYDLHRKMGVPAPRTAHARLYVNGAYNGLYTLIEQIDKRFLRDHFGDDEGNLYKAHGPWGTLEWLGSDPALYHNYELKTNEMENDYSNFIRFLDIVNNTSDAAFEASIEKIFNIDTFLAWLAVDATCAHLDNYAGLGNNYYIYDNPSTGKFEFIPWDLNLSFGSFKGQWTADEILALDVYNPYGNWAGGGFGLPILGVYQAGPAGAVAVGMPAFSTVYDGVVWRPEMTGSNQFLTDAWGTSMGNVVAVGQEGTILRYDGTQWSQEHSGVPELLFGVWAANASNFFAVGDRERVLHYDGTRWTSMSGGAGPALLDVWGTSPTDVYAAGAGTILHYDGNSWQPMPLPAGAPSWQWYLGLWGSAWNDIFAVGSGGTIIHHDGNTWSEMTSPTGVLLKSVWGAAWNDVFAVGDDGTIIHYDGFNWSPMSSGVTEHLEDVHGSSGSDLLAVGANGRVLHYDGLSWSPMDSGLFFHLDADRPLITRILNIPEHRETYEKKLRRLINGPFQPIRMEGEIDFIYDLIREDAHADTMKDYSNGDFDDSIVQDIPPTGPDRILGLKPFVQVRSVEVSAQLPP